MYGWTYVESVCVAKLQVQQVLAGIADRAKESKFLYSKFFAIGLFRLLELTGAKEPQALGNLVKAMNVRQDAVNRDLMTYKGVLSKLSAAKEARLPFPYHTAKSAVTACTSKAQPYPPTLHVIYHGQETMGIVH